MLNPVISLLNFLTEIDRECSNLVNQLCYSYKALKNNLFLSINFYGAPNTGHGKIKIAPYIKSCAQEDLVITRK